jgi:hypothetical protein
MKQRNIGGTGCGQVDNFKTQMVELGVKSPWYRLNGRLCELQSQFGQSQVEEYIVPLPGNEL